ncbi:6-hydroxy-D-nicotine oxidase [Kordia antarctica]|uniref:6-hydroxy-D-nicotine oxidase n=1 Tax=Kordia antarctica TaxID=1218801 RepID=A0A7L4ZED4_9FLAO|nr:FAD-dependent oxidoreductase [Kordia antarctica]QHI35098.1 6-hydroxy-D-nicotine oxidase [Kordia antarctica]
MNQSIKDKARKNLKIISKGDSLYHYARVISNTRFGYMPAAIVYCETAEDVSFCINYCRTYTVPFRIRSGGHQHEGMCSADNVIIIDLSEMNTIVYDTEDTAWIPVGKQLGKVYEELEKRDQTLPGGGCQSVNVGGLTQGGGWGTSIRKYGLTCDSVIECEIVLADGTVAIISDEDEDQDICDLFWALKGGGGGNFGVVTRFKFKLVSLLPVTTSFSFTLKSPKKSKSLIKTWANLHAKMNLDVNLSTACGVLVSEPEKEGEDVTVLARMGGLYYGSKKKLVALLAHHFGDLIPKDTSFAKQHPENYIDPEDQPEGFILKSMPTSENTLSFTAHQRFIADFVNPTGSLEYFENDDDKKCGNRKLTILAKAPDSTCDQPHPHKVTSAFPKDNIDHDILVDKIFDVLENTCYFSDVTRYMSFHCLGGAVTENPKDRVFAFSQKPYLLQIQAWWDNVANVFTNEKRNAEYVNWVKDFRKELSPYTEGSFINFVDSSLVEDIEKDENRLKLLEIYYGEENLEKLRAIKTKQDPNQLFKFEMSILPE